ncbi:PREDICTED: protein disulfide-isomerase-like [Priapulus caudatus]|uniref:protein disulfide-isomerase n=1 Tax=Priapulus caudatus TaxID=37621 RepID=A0ABM1DNX4_PRICU|nr:PREDICTED: protein disulfide-isomerase-like [Priapulus caudatus]
MKVRCLTLALLFALLCSAVLSTASQDGDAADDENSTDEEAVESVDDDADQGQDHARFDADEPLPGEEYVLELNNETFPAAIEEHKFLLLEFYAPWCGKCQQLRSAYGGAAQKLHEMGSEIKLAKIDATVMENLELSAKYEVDRFPTLRFFREMEPSPIPYKGERDVDGFVAWLTKKTQPPAKNLETLNDVKEFIASRGGEDINVVGFFKDANSEEAKTFIRVADIMDFYEFGITSDEEAFKEYGVEDGQISVFTTFDEGRADYDGELISDDIAKFVMVQSVPNVADFNPQMARRIFVKDFPNHLLLLASKNSTEFPKLHAILSEVAPKYKGRIVFIHVDTDVPGHARIMEFFAVDPADVPEFRITTSGLNAKKYRPDFPEITAATIQNFVDAFFDDKLEPFRKSEELPEDWNELPVTVLVGKNFDEVAKDEKTNTLVEFYAPWCEHCKSLEPIYTELGEKFKGRDDVIIAKIDGTANEVEGIKLEGFPTIKYFPAGTDKVIDYQCGRTVEHFTFFLENDGECPPREETPDDRDGDEEVEKNGEGEEITVETDETESEGAKDEL